MRQRLGRVRLKEATEARRVRKLRKAEAEREALVLFNSFVRDEDETTEEVVSPKEGEQSGECSDEEFWNKLADVEPSALQVCRNVKEPWEHTQRIAKPSRMHRLVACHSSKNEMMQS